MKQHLFYFLSISLLAFGCQSEKAIQIDKKALLENIKILSHDSLEGRGFTKKGNYKAQAFISNKFEQIGLEKVQNDDFIQKFPYTFTGKRRQRMFPVENAKEDFSNVPDTIVYGGNVVGKISGKTNKTIAISGHLDHLGIRNGKIYNGADDDASGTVALFAIAEYFKKNKTNHTLIFAAVDAEEIGSLGADYWLKNYPNKKDIILNVNMDMIAHNDSNELYACGTYHYPQLKAPLQKSTSTIHLLFGHDNPKDKSKEDWTFSSDHRIFHKEKVVSFKWIKFAIFYKICYFFSTT